jgi:catechol 2,3-dioxygenase-like lactoylglutathione lyase family enzyme
MAVLRPHLALTVSDVDRSLPFYRALLGRDPAKVRPGYAKFEVEEPALNLTLNRGDRAGALGALNHAGIQVSSTDDVLATRDRLAESGLVTFDEMDTTCCYARQDKVWVHDPDGIPWEVFTVLEDVDEERTLPQVPAACSLGNEDLDVQRARFGELAAHVTGLERTGPRLVAELDDAVDEVALGELMAVERGCCPFFRLEYDEDARRLAVSVSDPDQEPALDSIEEALTRV